MPSSHHSPAVSPRSATKKVFPLSHQHSAVTTHNNSGASSPTSHERSVFPLIPGDTATSERASSRPQAADGRHAQASPIGPTTAAPAGGYSYASLASTARSVTLDDVAVASAPQGGSKGDTPPLPSVATPTHVRAPPALASVSVPLRTSESPPPRPVSAAAPAAAAAGGAEERVSYVDESFVNPTEGSPSGYRRITSRRVDHGNTDTTSAAYETANVASTAELLASQYCNMSQAMADDIQSTPYSSATARQQQPPRGSSQRHTGLSVGSALSPNGTFKDPSQQSTNGRVFSPVDPAYAQGGDSQAAPLTATFEESLARLRETVVTKGGLSYELTHRSRLDRTQFIPNDVTSTSLGSVSLGSTQSIFSPGRVIRGGAPPSAAAAAGAPPPVRNAESPLRSAPLAPGRDNSVARDSVSITRPSSDGYTLVSVSSPTRGGSRAVQAANTPTSGGGIVRGSSTSRFVDYNLNSGAAYRFPSSRPITPVQEGSAVVSAALGATVIGYDYASRMQLSSPRHPVPSHIDMSPGGNAFFYSKPEDRCSPGRRSMSPFDRFRPKSSFC